MSWLGRGLLLFAGALLCGVPVSAHDSVPPGTDEPGTGVDNGVDPLYFRSRVEVVARSFDAPERSIAQGYTSSFKADWALTSADIFRIIVPYSHLEYHNGDSTNDFGDTELRFLRKVDRKSPDHYIDSVAFGFDLVIPTGDLYDRTGRAQWAVAPVLRFSAYPGHGVGIFPSFRLLKSISADESEAEDIAELEASSLFAWNHARWWIAAEPELAVDFDGGDTTTYALRVEAGVRLSRRFLILAGAGTSLGGSRERFDDEAFVGLRFLP
jgi:opacity protein-like surface antigen